MRWSYLINWRYGALNKNVNTPCFPRAAHVPSTAWFAYRFDFTPAALGDSFLSINQHNKHGYPCQTIPLQPEPYFPNPPPPHSVSLSLPDRPLVEPENSHTSSFTQAPWLHTVYFGGRLRHETAESRTHQQLVLALRQVSSLPLLFAIYTKVTQKKEGQRDWRTYFQLFLSFFAVVFSVFISGSVSAGVPYI